jgi:hypothetical protein
VGEGEGVPGAPELRDGVSKSTSSTRGETCVFKAKELVAAVGAYGAGVRQKLL